MIAGFLLTESFIEANKAILIIQNLYLSSFQHSNFLGISL
jgi:hypothetical protein